MTGKVCLIQFSKRPLSGFVKTRLIPELGAERALQVHLTLMKQTLTCLCQSELGDVEVWWDKEWQTDQFWQEGARQMERFQKGNDLGERMHFALKAVLERYDRALLVGSDCPVLDRAYLSQALSVLDQKDVVIGPAEDGGYVLIGAKRTEPGMLDNVSWGGDKVLASTLSSMEKVGLSVGLLDKKFDIDEPSDYYRWQVLEKNAPG